jgi:hypothetical protein
MGMQKTAVIFIAPDRGANVGDAKSMYEIAKAIEGRGYRQDRAYYAVRLPHVQDGGAGGAFPVNALPKDQPAYDEIPQAHAGILDQLKREGITDVKIVGLGSNTLDALKFMLDAGAAHGIHVSGACVAHTVPSVAALYDLADRNIRLIAPLTREMLTLAGRKKDKVIDPVAAVKLANRIDLVRIAAMPQEGFGDLKAFEPHHDMFMDTPNGKALRKHFKRGKEYNVLPVILNAGYGKPHEPAVGHESYVNGIMLSAMNEIYDPEKTMILAMDGGQRSLTDRAMGHDHMEMMINGMTENLGRAPMVLREIYIPDEEKKPGQDFDATRAATWLAAMDPRVRAAVSNAEGEHIVTNWAMFGRPEMPKYIFPYSLLDKDETGIRQAKIGIAWDYGFNVIRPESPSRPEAAMFRGKRVGAVRMENPVNRILEALDLAPQLKPAFNPMAEDRIERAMDLCLHGMTPPHLLRAA